MATTTMAVALKFMANNNASPEIKKITATATSPTTTYSRTRW